MKNRAIVIGAGLMGCVTARCLAEKGYSVDIYEKKNRIGGTLYDYPGENGEFIHACGPHIFHTASDKAYNFVRRFCEWQEYKHKVLADIDGVLCPLPFNFKSIENCFDEKTAKEYIRLLQDEISDGEIGIDILQKSREKRLQDLAEFIYNKVFLQYSQKQWGRNLIHMEAAVVQRVPVRASYEDSYFSDPCQLMPEKGYTFFLEQVISHPLIRIFLKWDAESHLYARDGQLYLDQEKVSDPVVYTGCLDAFFSFSCGVLPYRTLRFVLQRKNWPFQPAAVVNYPNAPDITRITEFGHFYPEREYKNSMIMFEYPAAYQHEDISAEPFYPVPAKDNDIMFQKYVRKAADILNFYPGGRLGDYRYLNMDETILEGIDLADKIDSDAGRKDRF